MLKKGQQRVVVVAGNPEVAARLDVRAMAGNLRFIERACRQRVSAGERLQPLDGLELRVNDLPVLGEVRQVHRLAGRNPSTHDGTTEPSTNWSCNVRTALTPSATGGCEERSHVRVAASPRGSPPHQAAQARRLQPPRQQPPAHPPPQTSTLGPTRWPAAATTCAAPLCSSISPSTPASTWSVTLGADSAASTVHGTHPPTDPRRRQPTHASAQAQAAARQPAQGPLGQAPHHRLDARPQHPRGRTHRLGPVDRRPQRRAREPDPAPPPRPHHRRPHPPRRHPHRHPRRLQHHRPPRAVPPASSASAPTPARPASRKPTATTNRCTRRC
jgi:hypothetical protein